MSLATSLFSAPLQTALSAVTAKPRSTAPADTTAGTGTTTGSASSATSGTTSIGSTFLSLLVQELQNQDPTAPMDSTAMVGQMISLNQLDQLTNINQTLTSAYGTGSSTTASGSSGSPSAMPGAQPTTAAAATEAALRLLSASPQASHPAVASSVTLPAF